MDSDDIFTKSAKGIEEIEKRSYHLDFRHRTALIQVDGRSEVGALLAKIPGDGLALLEELARDGFIAFADGRAAVAPVAPGPATAPAAQAATPSAHQGVKIDLGTAKKRASQSIVLLLGPDGDALAVAIERTTTFAEFTTRAERARDIIGQMRGAARAKEFWDSTGL